MPITRASFGSNLPEVFCKKGVLRYFTKFTRKYLCQSLFLQPEPCNFIKKRLRHRCFPVNFVKFLRTPFFIEQLWWLLLFPGGYEKHQSMHYHTFPIYWNITMQKTEIVNSRNYFHEIFILEMFDRVLNKSKYEANMKHLLHYCNKEIKGFTS